MTAQIEDKALGSVVTDDKGLKGYVDMAHIASDLPAKPSSLPPEDVTLTPQSLSPHTTSSTSGVHGSFHESDDLQKEHSAHADAFGSPRVEALADNADRSSTHSHNEASAAKHKAEPSEHEHSKKRRVDDQDDINIAQVEAYEELRKNAFAALQYIEQDFAKLRDRLYHERIAELEKEVQAIASGKHPEYAVAIADIERRRKKQLDEVSEWRRHKSNDVTRQVHSSQRLAQVHFLAKRAELRRSIIDDIIKKRQLLRDEMLHYDGSVTTLPSESTLRQYREQNTKQNKEVIEISSAIGFPISGKPTGLQESESEMDIQMIQQHTAPSEKSRISYIT